MEELKWFFDLQRFTDGEEDGGGSEDIDNELDAGTDENDESGSSGDPLIIPGKLGLTKDGQLQYVEGDEDNGDSNEDDESGEEGEEDVGEGKAKPDAKQQTKGEDGEKKPSFYSSEELFGIAVTNPAALDPARIPPESLPLYRALVANQAKQAPKETTKEPEKKEPPEKQLTPEELSAQITADATKKVVKALKEKGIEFDEYSLDHQRMVLREELRIEREMAEAAEKKRTVTEQEKAVQESVNQVYAKIQEKIAALEKQHGADFAGIDALTVTHIQTMPFQRAAPIAAAIERLNSGKATESDIPVLEGYFEECRREYFAKKTGVTKEPKQVPPQQLKPGNDKEQKERLDPKALGKMTQEERIEHYKRTGLADKLANLD